jgi:hypothetical protein
VSAWYEVHLWQAVDLTWTHHLVPDRMGRKLEGGEEVFFELVITVAIAERA